MKSDPLINLLPAQGEVFYFQGFLSSRESEELFEFLKKRIDWQQMPIKIFGKTMLQPRLTAWFADEGVKYQYSGLKLESQSWPEPLSALKLKVEKLTGKVFNSALLNLYRDGKDSMGWHRDNEKELGLNPTIASVSLGATRIFKLRKYSDKTGLKSLALENGSLLMMQGESQHHWEHSVPKTAGACGERINITFRKIM